MIAYELGRLANALSSILEGTHLVRVEKNRDGTGVTTIRVVPKS